MKSITEKAKIHPIFKPMYILLLISIITKFIGFIKIRVLADLFGGSKDLDIFWASFAIPDAVFNLLITGTINSAIIPLFSTMLHTDDRKYLYDFFKKVIVGYTLIVSTISFYVVFFSDNIAQLMVGENKVVSFLTGGIAPSLSGQDLSLYSSLNSILIISTLLLTISTLLTALNQSADKFISSAIAGLIYNISLIVGSYISYYLFDSDMRVIAGSILLGAGLHIATQVPDTVTVFKNYLLEHRRTKDPILLQRLVNMTKTSLPRVISILFEQFSAVYSTLIGLAFSAGSLSAYRFAFSLHLVPSQILSASLGTISLPTFSKLYATKDYDEFSKRLKRYILVSLYILMPFVIVFMVLRLPIVRLTIGTRNFAWEDTILTSWSLFFLAINIPIQVANSLLLKSFYACKKTTLPLIAIIVSTMFHISFVDEFINLISNYYSWRPLWAQLFTGDISAIYDLITGIPIWLNRRADIEYSVGGIALSLAVSFLIEFIVLLFLFRISIKEISLKGLIRESTKIIGISIFSGLSGYIFYRLIDTHIDSSRVIGVVLVFSFSTAFIYFNYIFLSYLLNIESALFLYKKYAEKYINRFIYRFRHNRLSINHE